jgi:hypothetical protein
MMTPANSRMMEKVTMAITRFTGFAVMPIPARTLRTTEVTLRSQAWLDTE